MTGGWFIIVLPTLHGYINGGGFAYFPCLICLRVHMIKGCPTWFFMIFSRCFFLMKQSRDVHGTSNPIYKHGTSWDFKYIMSKNFLLGCCWSEKGFMLGTDEKGVSVSIGLLLQSAELSTTLFWQSPISWSDCYKKGGKMIPSGDDLQFAMVKPWPLSK